MNVSRVTDPNQPGIRYWRPAIYVALQKSVAKDETQTCEFKTLTLPDKSEEYAITFTPGMGTANVTPTLYEGWRLDSLNANLDSKTAENLNAVTGLFKAIVAGTPGAKSAVAPPNRNRAKELPCLGVYRLEYDQMGVLTGFKPIPMPGLY
ncbi:hypothetical protein [Microvirga sp. 17 mud 1-3]|uniref:hypothetical protein n=1 Tax=Microvirga sp. 17 mud 1-3 TaxID=2082949 RepID=UPI000D6D0410|nr:hypothetical protein [Microvirga sp. 17 mud 1-3]AWM87586.1 hypothetical protein C4E04_13140 [Microvirga sp. 17 mud 1-3]